MSSISKLNLNNASGSTITKAHFSGDLKDSGGLFENGGNLGISIGLFTSNGSIAGDVSMDAFSMSIFTNAGSSITDAMSNISKVTSKSDNASTLSLGQDVENYQKDLDNQRTLMEGVADKVSGIDSKLDEFSSAYNDLSSALAASEESLSKLQEEYNKADSSKKESLKNKINDAKKKVEKDKEQIERFKQQSKTETASLVEQKQQLAAEASQYQAEAQKIMNKANLASAKAKSTENVIENKKDVKHDDIAARVVNNEIVDETMANGIINKLGDDADFINADQLTGVSYDTARNMASEMVAAHKDYSGNNDAAQSDGSSVANNQSAKTAFLNEFSTTKFKSDENYEFLSVGEKYDYSSMMSVASKLGNNEYVDTDETNKAMDIAKLISGKNTEEENSTDATNPFKYNRSELETQKVA